MAIRPRSTRVSPILKTSTTILAVLLLSLLLGPLSRAQSSGSPKWIAATSPEAGGSGSASALAIDSQGNVYVTGGETVTSNFCPAPQSCNDAVTIKYDSSGKVLWKDWLNTDTPGSAQGTNVAVDSSGNAYVLFSYTRGGASPFFNPFIPEIVTAKYNPAGGRDWKNVIDSNSSGTVQLYPVGIAVSPAGNVYVSYEMQTANAAATGSTLTAVTIKYDTAGHLLWSQPLNDATGTNASTQPFAIGIDASENVYVQVALSSTTGNDGEIVKYNTDGVRLASFGRGQISFAVSLHVDPDGTCYFSGANAFSDQPYHSIVAKFSPTGSLVYIFDITAVEGIAGEQMAVGGPNGAATQIASDSAGDAFVLQRYDNKGPHGDGNLISVLKLDPSGHKLFATHYNSQSDGSGQASSVALAVSPSGDIYVTGRSAPEDHTSNNFWFVTIKYDTSGAEQWARQYAGPNLQASPQAIALSGDSVIVTGSAASGSLGEWVTIAYVP